MKQGNYVDPLVQELGDLVGDPFMRHAGQHSSRTRRFSWEPLMRHAL